MQIYADATGREMRVARSAQACALGSAVAAAVMAGVHPDFATAQKAMTGWKDVVYKPCRADKATYNKLYKLYMKLYDNLGGVRNVNLGRVMKDLLEIKDNAAK
jgi:L-ribulokinase